MSYKVIQIDIYSYINHVDLIQSNELSSTYSLLITSVKLRKTKQITQLLPIRPKLYVRQTELHTPRPKLYEYVRQTELLRILSLNHLFAFLITTICSPTK